MKRWLICALLCLLAAFSAASAFAESAFAELAKPPVLLYHALTEDRALAEQNFMYVTTDKFEWDLQMIAAYGYTPIFAEELLTTKAEKPIVITFDDGYLSNYTLAYPLLQRYGMKATVFTNAVTAETGAVHKMSWKQLGELSRSGLFSIQCHTSYLHYQREDATSYVLRAENELRPLYEARIRSDIAAFQANCQIYTGRRATAFAYPYGQYDAESNALLQTQFPLLFGTTPYRESSDAVIYRIGVFQETDLTAVFDALQTEGE